MSRSGRAPALALLCGLLLAACGNRERDQALQRLRGPVAGQRAEAVRTLGRIVKPADDEVWVALERATRDPSPAVRIAVAEALLSAPKAAGAAPDERGAVADDALAAMLSDLDEGVRTAAAQALGKRCGERPIAYLRGAFNRSGAAARAAIAAALQGCGVGNEQLFRHSEEVRRMRAVDWLSSAAPAQRAWAAGELGRLGRPEDVARLSALLGDRDGVVVAAAATGLGHARAQASAKALARLAADPVPLVASAAIQALGELGPEALRAAQPALEKQSAAEGEQAPGAALALAQLARGDRRCALARDARVPAAAAVLAAGCPIGPLAAALAQAVPHQGPVAPAAAARCTALLEALLQAAPQPPGAAAGAALGRLAQLAGEPLSARAAEVAGQLKAKEAGPLLLAVIKRERAAREKELAARAKQPADDGEAAAEVARQAAVAPAAERDKYARLMKLLQERNAKVAAREGAAERLAALLRGGPPAFGARKLLAASLRAGLQLAVPGVAAEAAALAADPDREIAAAARGAPGPSPVAPAPDGEAPLDGCFPANPPAPGAPAPGCLARALSLPVSALPAPALPMARAALWSEDGAERAAACSLLARADDAASAPLRAALAADPEERARAACAARNETAPPGPR